MACFTWTGTSAGDHAALLGNELRWKVKVLPSIQMLQEIALVVRVLVLAGMAKSVRLLWACSAFLVLHRAFISHGPTDVPNIDHVSFHRTKKHSPATLTCVLHNVMMG